MFVWHNSTKKKRIFLVSTRSSNFVLHVVLSCIFVLALNINLCSKVTLCQTNLFFLNVTQKPGISIWLHKVTNHVGSMYRFVFPMSYYLSIFQQNSSHDKLTLSNIQCISHLQYANHLHILC